MYSRERDESVWRLGLSWTEIVMYMEQQRLSQVEKSNAEVKYRPLWWSFGAYFSVDLHAIKFFDGEATRDQ